MNSDSYDSTTTTLPASLHSVSSSPAPSRPTSPRPTSPQQTSPQQTSPTQTSFVEDLSSDDCDIIEFNFNFIIRQCNEKTKPAKWESFKVYTLIEFEDEILELVQDQFDPLIRKKDYIVIYKSSINGMGTQLTEEKCWKKFLSDYQRFLSNRKELFVIVEINEKKNKRKKR